MCQATEDMRQPERGLASTCVRAAHGLSKWTVQLCRLQQLGSHSNTIAPSQSLGPRAAILSGLGLESARFIMVAISNPSPLAWDTDCHDDPSDTHCLRSLR